ncbi:MAG: YigZ family protein [Clostridia bacterium]|nr:YigZ family protein [Clostridia bacterium]
MGAFRTVKAPGETELVIQKSRFIGRCFPVESEADALAVLSDIRKKHWDATHNCYAYRIGEHGDCARYSDDGEPGGTAGMPMMEALRNRGLTNVLAVVTRYFGGTLLGAGGLVRAYSKATSEAAYAAGVVEVLPALRFALRVEYGRYGGIEAFVRESAQVEELAFGEDVRILALVEAERAAAFCKEIVERSDGRCNPSPQGQGWLRRET